MRPSTPITAPTTPPTLSSTSPSQPSTSQNSSPPASPPPPTPSSIPPTPRSVVVQLQEFFDEPWVKKATPEILFIKRASRLTDKWSGHIAFPGELLSLWLLRAPCFLTGVHIRKVEDRSQKTRMLIMQLCVRRGKVSFLFLIFKPTTTVTDADPFFTQNQRGWIGSR